MALLNMARIRETILETLSARGALPLPEIARAVGLTTTATRYHIGLLECEGLVKRCPAQHHGNVGRPVLIYALAEAGCECLPKQYAVLAQELLAEIEASIGQDESRLLLRRIGRRVAESAPSLRPGAGAQARLRRAARFLGARGYVAQITSNKRISALTVLSCPYRRVAQTHPELCAMDTAMMQALLGARGTAVRHRRNANGQCQFEIARDRL